MRQHPLPKPLREWMDAHGQRDFMTCAVAAYYMQRHYPDLLEGNYGVRCGQPCVLETGLQTRFVYDLWRAELGGSHDNGAAEETMRACMDWYQLSEERCKAAIEFEAWLREEPAPPWAPVKRPWPPNRFRSIPPGLSGPG